MQRYIAARLIQAVITLLLLSLAVFLRRSNDRQRRGLPDRPRGRGLG